MVNRPEKVTVKALDENGKEITIKGEGLLAQCLCHELNHLDGILFVDLMEPGTLEYLDPNKE
jgi:peptide deformylase